MCVNFLNGQCNLKLVIPSFRHQTWSLSWDWSVFLLSHTQTYSHRGTQWSFWRFWAMGYVCGLLLCIFPSAAWWKFPSEAAGALGISEAESGEADEGLLLASPSQPWSLFNPHLASWSQFKDLFKTSSQACSAFRILLLSCESTGDCLHSSFLIIFQRALSFCVLKSLCINSPFWTTAISRCDFSLYLPANWVARSWVFKLDGNYSVAL